MIPLLSLLTKILLIVSFLGYFFLAKQRLSLKQEFIPIFVFSSITYIVYLCGLFGWLFQGSIIVMAVGILVFTLILFRRFRNGPTFPHFLFLVSTCISTGKLIFFCSLIPMQPDPL